MFSNHLQRHVSRLAEINMTTYRIAVVHILSTESQICISCSPA